LLRKNKDLNQYGLLWSVASSVSGLLATMIQRQCTDQSLFALQLLGYNRIFRFAPYDAGPSTLLGLINPKSFNEEAQKRADHLWEEGEVTNLSGWIQNFWMKNPPVPERAAVQPSRLAATD
jgi:hypothetical protein